MPVATVHRGILSRLYTREYRRCKFSLDLSSMCYWQLSHDYEIQRYAVACSCWQLRACSADESFVNAAVIACRRAVRVCFGICNRTHGVSTGTWCWNCENRGLFVTFYVAKRRLYALRVLRENASSSRRLLCVLFCYLTLVPLQDYVNRCSQYSVSTFINRQLLGV